MAACGGGSSGQPSPGSGPLDGVAELGPFGRVQGPVLGWVGELEQPLGAAADLVDQLGAGAAGAGVAAQQRQVLLVMGAPLLVGGHHERPCRGPVGVGRAELLVAGVPVGLVAAGQLGQRPGAGLIPDLSGGGVGGQLPAGLLPVALVLVGMAAGQLGQRPGAAGAVAAAVLALAAALLALGGAAGASLGVDVEQLHPLDLPAVVAALGQHGRLPAIKASPFAVRTSSWRGGTGGWSRRATVTVGGVSSW